jgi:hypothetical protein
MRKLMAAGLLALPLGLGCSHVGGECDCAPVPGDSNGYNPHIIYHATCPGGCPTAPGAQAAPTQPVSANRGAAFEQIGPPRSVNGKSKL